MIALALLALAACNAEPPAPPTKGDTAAAVKLDGGSWRALGDGSMLRLTDGAIGARQEADRCWTHADGVDCLSLDAIPYETGPIVVASRAQLTRYEDLPVAPAAAGYSCAIYPSGMIEQRLIGDDGDWQRQDDSDGGLWTARDVDRLGAGGGFVDCAALKLQLGEAGIAALGTEGFARVPTLPTS